MTVKKFEEIVAWQKGRLLNNELFIEFSNIRDFTFKDQILRASLSITNNIAEDFERGIDKDFRHFLYIARGSAAEVRSMLYAALDTGYLSQERHDELMLLVEETGRLLTGFIKTLSEVRPGR